MSISRCAARKQVVTAAIIDGKAFAEGLRARVAAAVPAFAAQAGRPPGLAVVLVGEDPPSRVYVRAKGKATIAAGMESFEHLLDDDTTQESLLALVGTLNEDERVDGILVQLPLPGQIDEKAVIDALDPAKDVDGFHIDNVGKLAVGEEALVPCTPLGCVMMLKDRLGDLSGLEAVVLGRSNIVGKPMAHLLLQANATVTVCHSRTEELERHTLDADILVAAVGRLHVIGAEMVKAGATVIDVGMNRTDDGLFGDVDPGAMERAAYMTPVPGGVGPMTIAMVLKNTVSAARARHVPIVAKPSH